MLQPHHRCSVCAVLFLLVPSLFRAVQAGSARGRYPACSSCCSEILGGASAATSATAQSVIIFTFKCTLYIHSECASGECERDRGSGDCTRWVSCWHAWSPAPAIADDRGGIACGVRSQHSPTSDALC